MSRDPLHIAVLGPGLMGASLLAALGAKSPQTKLSAWARRPETIDQIRQRGLAEHASTDAAEAVAGADTVVLCVPVDCMPQIAHSIAPHIGPDTVVTDVGSTKATLTSRLEEIFSAGKNFVGSHPMCGSDQSGLQAARADLYEGALCVLCPTPMTRPALLAKAEKLWHLVGARTAQLSPAEHDRAAASTSHVPHVAAAALVNLVAGEPQALRALCASGFRDTTRIAAGSPDLWAAILSANAHEVSPALERLEKILADYRKAIACGDKERISRVLREATETRASLFPAE